MKNKLLKNYLVFVYRSINNSGIKEFSKDFDNENEAIEYAKDLKINTQCNWVDITDLKTGKAIFKC